MPRTLSMFIEGFFDFKKVLMKKMTVYDLSVVKYICFVVGILFACLFPRFARKTRKAFVFAGIFMSIPVLMKVYRIFKETFHYRYL
ncbi:MAG: hypothetical protein IJB48_05180 [Clostridia bacterium]|nr:hypothetical protein [Clostridia bacterium]